MDGSALITLVICIVMGVILLPIMALFVIFAAPVWVPWWAVRRWRGRRPTA